LTPPLSDEDVRRIAKELCSSEDHVKKISQQIGSSWWFRLKFLGLALAAGVGGSVVLWKLTVNQFRSQVQRYVGEMGSNASNRIDEAYQGVTNRIAWEFAQPRISNTIAQVATAHATNVISAAVSPAMTLVQSNLDKAFDQFKSRAETKLVEFDKRLKPRSITPSQVTNFVFLTERLSKIPIKIVIGQEGSDTETFGYQLRSMFNRAGFLTPSNAGPSGIQREPHLIPVRGIADVGRPSSMPPGAAIIIGTNGIPSYWPPWPDVFFVTSPHGPAYIYDWEIKSEWVGNISRYVVETNNTRQIYEAINRSLTECGITTGWMSSEGWVPGEFAILIPAIRH
jgi:hypothetical protein